MTGCERCNTVNTAKRHVYIVLFKGDDSDFAWNQNIEITLETEMDLTGFRAKFSFMDFTQEFADITSKKLVLVFPATATSSFPLGAADASIVLYDSDGKARTIANRIHMIVTKCVDEAYANEDPQAITVSISSSMEREQADWDETDTQSPSYIRNKPEIPTIDATLTQSGAAADAKAVGDALRSGFTEWEFSGSGYDSTKTYSVLISQSSLEGNYDYDLKVDGVYAETVYGTSECPTSIDFGVSSITATRHLITPTKTSQLTNDGAPNGGGTPYATTAQVAAKQDALSFAQLAAVNSGVTSAKVATWDGYAAQIAQKANTSDVNAALSQKADTTDLPYRLVEPGKWEFSEQQGLTNFSVTGIEYSAGYWTLYYTSSETGSDSVSEVGSETDLSVLFHAGMSGDVPVTATRASLPGHLLDRAGNRVVVSVDTTLTLPAAVPGYLRDFLVRLEINGSTVPTITFAAPTGETITYETDGDDFPVPDEAGDWLYSFTESCVAHKFAVALKKVNTVAQGGS